MNKRRLLKLADLLEADAGNRKGVKFDLGLWGEVTNADKPLSCGTTACAMGLAALSGAFHRQGLRCDLIGGRVDITTVEGAWNGFGAAEELFEISDHEAEWLFDPCHYDGLPTSGSRGERAVAKRIREFVAGNDWPPHDAAGEV